ncbi:MULTISPECIES: tryptophan halogenase family protein [unclassified Roseateles]|uniref:tryptophan halogenase family protein n=1 Tax=unclassified Roseateles TaxID=2626991 RepID=UPI0006FBE5EC|nr:MULTISPECIES: tryptophan halogenase family protein [unclassified Roseateles]KQW49749.1 tryptophan halogenase [Pelomonas sp. Root405]KRA74919.1 tryptophan halogenase [Pelomonas sp. Root662]
MSDPSIRKIVIVGGGTAGWMAAAPLAQRFAAAGPGRCEIALVESPDIGTIGVGEATLPPIRAYNRTLGLDGADFVKRTQGSFKLGIEFRDWGRVGHRFFHGFGDFGPAIEGRSPWQHWLRLQREVAQLPTYEDWSTSTVMARGNRFTPPENGAPSAANAYSFAYHFDAGLYAAYLREYALQRGVQRIEGLIVDVELRPEDGFVAAVKLADGRRIDGDLFIDCSGFRALLIGGAMQSPYEDWSALLPCNSAQAVPSERIEPLTPYTTSTAKAAGWQWRIPLQHRTGNGHVYCSHFISDDEAAATLLAGLDSKALDTPRQLRFTTGRRQQGWVKNVVAIGLASGFLEPLESTSIQLIMDGVGRLIQFFPDRHFKPHLAAEFNRLMGQQYESTRDFIVLHYKLTERRDSELWRYCAAMPIPDNLAHQIELFRTTGRVAILDRDSFAEPSWVSLFLGLGLTPEGYDPFVDHVDAQALLQHFVRLRQAIAQTVNGMPAHADYIASHVKAAPA